MIDEWPAAMIDEWSETGVTIPWREIPGREIPGREIPGREMSSSLVETRLPKCLDVHCTVGRMSAALREVPVIGEAGRRAEAYRGAGIEAGDAARFDGLARRAEETRRTLFGPAPTRGATR
jgi:hypothetical protein